MSTPIVCRLFGTQVLTHVEPHCVHQGTGPIGLEIVPLDPAEPGTDALGPSALSVPMLHPDGEGKYEMWPCGESLRLRVAPVAEFRCSPARLEFRMLRPLPDEALQWQTFGLGMSVWSEWAGRPVLHGATVDVEGAAVSFLGPSGAGKSSLTMEFLLHGHRVFGDDLLVLDATSEWIEAVPSIPWLKIGPAIASAARFDRASLPLLHSKGAKRRLDLTAGMWAEAPARLGPLYVLERGGCESDVAIERVDPAASVLALIQYSYAPRTVAAAGLSARRLSLLADAAQQAGVWRLRYPDGLEWLPKVREAVVRHVSESRARSLR